MTGSDGALVTETPLEWEVGAIGDVAVNDLEPHPKNAEIYGDHSDPGKFFIESVRQKGVLEPLVVTDTGRIISGHRRWAAAKAVGIDHVPARTCSFDDELTEREAIIEFNRHREKTPGQIVNEFEEALAIERERAKERQGERTDLTGEHLGNVTEKSKAPKESREIAAEKINADVGGQTLEKGLKVKEKAEDDETPDEVRTTAKEQWDRLKDGQTSFSAASKAVEKAEAEIKVKAQRGDEQTSANIVHADVTDFVDTIDDGSVDLLLTDPPYSTEIDDVYAFAASWLPPTLECVADDGFAFVFIGAYPDELRAYLEVVDHLTEWDCSQVLVWTYRNTLGQTPNDRYKLNWQAILFMRGADAPGIDAPKTSEQWAVHDVNAPDARTGTRHHKWEKPTELIDRLIRHTTNDGDTILDPFAGTGTVPIVCADLGREVLACDVDADILAIAADRGCSIDD